MSSANRFTRIATSINLPRLTAARALVVGLGSGGSTVALELAKSGIGHLVLCDPDVLEEHNLVRHEGDERYLGISKPRAVADLARHRNPELDVAWIEAPIEQAPDPQQLIATCDVVAVCTDTDASRHFVNQMALKARTPVVFGGVYPGAAGGEVITCHSDGQSPCLACIEATLRDQRPGPDGELTYGLADDQLAAMPGLGLDVRLVALLHTKRVLELLSGTDSEPHHVLLFATAAIDELLPRPYASARLQIARLPDCLMCSGPK